MVLMGTAHLKGFLQIRYAQKASIKKGINMSLMGPQTNIRPLLHKIQTQHGPMNQRFFANRIAIVLFVLSQGLLSTYSYAQSQITCPVSGVIELSGNNVNNELCTINDSGALTIRSDGALLTNNGTVDNNGSLFNEYSFDNYGILNNKEGGTLANNDTLFNYNTGELNNSGTFTSFLLGNEGTLNNNTGGTLTNTSFFVNSSIVNNAGALNNNDTLENSGRFYNNFGGTLTNNGIFTNNDLIENYDTIFNDGVLTNNDIIENSNMFNNDGTLTNNAVFNNFFGNLNNNANGTFTNDAEMYNYSGTINNDGLLSNNGLIESEGTINNNGMLNNNNQLIITVYGTLNNQDTLTNDAFIVNDGVVNNDGTLVLQAGSVFNNTNTIALFSTLRQTDGHTIANGDLTGEGVIDIQGGLLTGDGSIAGRNIVIGENSTVSAGESTGTLIFINDVDFAGTLRTDIDSSSTYDIVDVQATISLSEQTNLEFVFNDNHVVSDGDSFDFLQAMDFIFSADVTFDDWLSAIDISVMGLDNAFGWAVSFTDNMGNSPSFLSLSVYSNDPTSTVPTPEVWKLVCLSLPMLAWIRRRMKHKTD